MKSFLVVAQEQLEGHHGTLDDLDELEGMMEEMVQRVQHVEVSATWATFLRRMLNHDADRDLNEPEQPSGGAHDAG